MEQLPYYNSFFQTAQLPAVELAQALAEVTPAQYNRVFFGCSGSDANDTIVRLARYYWKLHGQEQRQTIISRHNAYHGSTLAGASLGGMKSMHAQGGLPIPASSTSNNPIISRMKAVCPRRILAARRRAHWRIKSTRSAPTGSRRSSANRFRAPAA